jgi:hypothetical protein
MSNTERDAALNRLRALGAAHKTGRDMRVAKTLDEFTRATLAHVRALDAYAASDEANRAHAAKLARLARLQNRPTRYEITATREGCDTLLIGYTPRVSRIGLLHVMQRQHVELIARLGIGDDDEIAWHTRPRVHATTSGWSIGFTGRTQRDAILSGEFPFIGEGA